MIAGNRGRPRIRLQGSGTQLGIFDRVKVLALFQRFIPLLNRERRAGAAEDIQQAYLLRSSSLSIGAFPWRKSPDAEIDRQVAVIERIEGDVIGGPILRAFDVKVGPVERDAVGGDGFDFGVASVIVGFDLHLNVVVAIRGDFEFLAQAGVGRMVGDGGGVIGAIIRTTPSSAKLNLGLNATGGSAWKVASCL